LCSLLVKRILRRRLQDFTGRKLISIGNSYICSIKIFMDSTLIYNVVMNMGLVEHL
jgi:hypothetical protein